MTTTVNKIRLAEVAPSHCSSCFNQRPDVPHVDFMSAFDGPVFERGVQIDDLIVCEDCIREAASVLPDVNAPDKQRMATLAERNEILEAANAGQAQYIEKLEAAIQAKPEARKRGAR